MHRALALAQTDGVPVGANPRVGCLLLDRAGQVVAEGRHRGAGTAHAEADALSQVVDLRGGTAVVTLEPCNHQGRTGPCTEALIDSGLRRVVFAQSDPNPLAAGGARRLRDAGVEVADGLGADEARAINESWTFAMINSRPFVRWKYAATLDGRTAAADGSSRWISSFEARQDVQRLRSEADVILAGTGTVLADDPELTRRDAAGAAHPYADQPLRAVMGLSPLPPDARIFNQAADTTLLRTREPDVALKSLHGAERRHVLLESGPRLAAAFLRCGLVDEVVCYLAPVLLGSGSTVVTDLGISTISQAMRLDVTDITTIGSGPDRNVRITLNPRKREATCSPES